MENAAVGPGRYERRKATTRAGIVKAANALFDSGGYESTSVEDIARAADVAVRTIYLHFDSKAAILLAYFDEWLDAFVEAIIARPVDEPIGEAVEAALSGLTAAGWEDRAIAGSEGPHPMVTLISEGSTDIIGHVLQSWVRAQDRIVEDALERAAFPPGSLEPRIRAAAVFASWFATILAVRDGYRGSGLSRDLSGNQIGARIASRFSEGGI
jgi:AcrR family transcriptional regulator